MRHSGHVRQYTPLLSYCCRGSGLKGLKVSRLLIVLLTLYDTRNCVPFQKFSDDSCLPPNVGKFGPGVFIVVCIILVSRFAGLFDDGCVIAIVSDYLFNNVLSMFFASIAQSVGVYSIDHVSNSCLFMFSGVARVFVGDYVSSCRFAMYTEC
jgi:hypothetical protein